MLATDTRLFDSKGNNQIYIYIYCNRHYLRVVRENISLYLLDFNQVTTELCRNIGDNLFCGNGGVHASRKAHISVFSFY